MEEILCRACMHSGTVKIPLDEWFVTNYNLLTGLNVMLQDHLPQYICLKCADVIKQFIEFRENSIRSESTLRNRLEIKSEEQETYIKNEIQVKDENSMETETQTDNYLDDSMEGCVSFEEQDETEKPKIKKNKIKNLGNSRNKKKKISLKKEKLMCGICSNYFETSHDLKEHIETHKTSNKCGICHERTYGWPQLFSHSITHLPEKQKKCYLCNRKYNLPSSMEYHYVVSHCAGKEKVMTCQLCSKTFSTLRKYRNHLASVHAEKKYICDYCSKRYQCRSALKAHIAFHLDYKAFPCDLCERSYKSRSALRAHHIKNHCPESVKCNVCRQYFKNQEELNKHEIKCNNAPVVCPICGVNTPALEMTRHMLKHTRKKSTYKCERCPSVLMSRAAFKAHTDRHDGNRTKACEYCPAKFYSATTLIKHRRTHTGERPYVCKICNKGFMANHNLKMHMRVHGQFIINKRNMEET